MRDSYRAMLLAGAFALSGCASPMMGDAHGQRMGESPMGANTHEPMMMGMTPLVGCHGAHGDVEAWLANLRTDLYITPAQDSLWSAYAEAFRAHAGNMASMMGMHAGGDAAPPPLLDRLRHHDSMMSQHLASFQALRAAIERLYASFSAEQRAAAEALRCERP